MIEGRGVCREPVVDCGDAGYGGALTSEVVLAMHVTDRLVYGWYMRAGLYIRQSAAKACRVRSCIL